MPIGRGVLNSVLQEEFDAWLCIHQTRWAVPYFASKREAVQVHSKNRELPAISAILVSERMRERQSA